MELIKTIHQNIYNYLLYASYILIFLTLTGISSIAPQYLDKLYNFIKIYISTILLLKFNPFLNNNKISKFDKQLIFSASLFLLFTTSLTIHFTPLNILKPI